MIIECVAGEGSLLWCMLSLLGPPHPHPHPHPHPPVSESHRVSPIGLASVEQSLDMHAPLAGSRAVNLRSNKT
jgi:hypothetical protein